MISARGLVHLRASEGLRLEAYPDPASGGDPWTIGYGHTQGVLPGDHCTREQAEAWLLADVAEAEAGIDQLVRVQISQGQRDALISFVFNIGADIDADDKAEGLGDSTLLRKLNTGDYAGAADEFPKWNKAAGRAMPGLTKRRQDERAMFLGTIQPPSPRSEPTAMIPFVAAGLSALIQAAPSLIRIFGSSPQAEKNAQAAEAVAEIAKAATGETTVEGAVRAIENDPAKAQAYREAVHANMGQLLGCLIQAQEADDKSRDKATERNLMLARETGGRWLWLLGAIAMIVVLASYGITSAVMFWSGSTISDETKALLLGQIVIFGFVTVLGFLFGSNIQNRIRDTKE